MPEERADEKMEIRGRIADILCALKWGSPSEERLKAAREKVEQAAKILAAETAVRGTKA